MKSYLGILLLVATVVSGIARADGELNFVQPGHWYSVSNPKGEYLIDPGRNDEDVKVITVFGSQWCWVEYDSITLPRDPKGQVVVDRSGVWLNFAHLLTVRPSAEPDYKYYKKQYAGGVKIVPSQPMP